MHELLKLNWEAFNPRTGLNVLVSAFLVFGLMHLTGESWIATGMALLFAWFTNVPGSIRDRASGMVAFAIGAIVITIVSGSLGLGLWTNIFLLVVVGFIGTLADFSDPPAFEAMARQARRIGFEGAFCIHPLQVEILNRAFAPDDDNVHTS